MYLALGDIKHIFLNSIIRAYYRNFTNNNPIKFKANKNLTVFNAVYRACPDILWVNNQGVVITSTSNNSNEITLDHSRIQSKQKG